MVNKLEKIAIIDLGSNTARLLLVEVKDNGHFQIVDQLKEAPRLGEGMERDGFLKPARIQETIKTLKMKELLPLQLPQFVAQKTNVVFLTKFQQLAELNFAY